MSGRVGLGSRDGSQDTQVTGQNAFVQFAVSVFVATSDTALGAFLQLRSTMRSDPQVDSLYRCALAGTLSLDVEPLLDRVRNQIMGWDLGAIARQVVMPLVSGYLGYAAAIAAGLTGAVPVLIGFLIGAVIWLAMAPGTWQMLKEKISNTIELIFKPTGA
jgi:hypothetical protein